MIIFLWKSHHIEEFINGANYWLNDWEWEGVSLLAIHSFGTQLARFHNTLYTFSLLGAFTGLPHTWHTNDAAT